eukprot:m51a1_g308 hypothetical protein (154) ;mRNA; r:396888-397598
MDELQAAFSCIESEQDDLDHDYKALLTAAPEAVVVGCAYRMSFTLARTRGECEDRVLVELRFVRALWAVAGLQTTAGLEGLSLLLGVLVTTAPGEVLSDVCTADVAAASTTCSACKQPILADIVVAVEDGTLMHRRCYACGICGLHLDLEQLL